MSAKSNRDLAPGLYERLLDEELSLALAARHTVQWRTRPTRFRRIPDSVAATTTRVRPCNPCRRRHTAGMVTRPRLENLTVVAVVAMTVEMTRRYWLSQLIYDS